MWQILHALLIFKDKSLYFCRAKGEMAERSNAAVLKTVVPVTEPGVRIPLSPLIEF